MSDIKSVMGCFAKSVLLMTTRVLAPTQWTGLLRTNPDLQSSSSEAQNNVLSFGDFSLHGHCAAGAARTAKLAA
jgi:hypothetical protein